MQTFIYPACWQSCTTPRCACSSFSGVRRGSKKQRTGSHHATSARRTRRCHFPEHAPTASRLARASPSAVLHPLRLTVCTAASSASCCATDTGDHDAYVRCSSGRGARTALSETLQQTKRAGMLPVTCAALQRAGFTICTAPAPCPQSTEQLCIQADLNQIKFPSNPLDGAPAHTHLPPAVAGAGSKVTKPYVFQHHAVQLCQRPRSRQVHLRAGRECHSAHHRRHMPWRRPWHLGAGLCARTRIATRPSSRLQDADSILTRMRSISSDSERGISQRMCVTCPNILNYESRSTDSPNQ